jgi:lysophospholipase L1-like esterase
MPPEPARPRLHVVGDSISIHYGPYLEAFLAPWAEYSRKTGPRGETDETAANGGDSAQVLAYLRGLDPGAAFDWLLLNCGLHDLRRAPGRGPAQVPLDAYRANLQASLDLLQARGWRPLWARTTPVVEALHNRGQVEFERYAADVAAYNAAADELMRARGVPVLDLFTFTQTLGEAAYCDHVHFSPAARAQQAAFLAGGLYPRLGQAPGAEARHDPTTL